MGELIKFGGGGETAITPAAGIAVALAVLLILLLPRKYVVVPFLLAVLFIPIGEQIVLGGMHLMMFRVVIFFGALRLLFSRITSPPNGEKFRLNRLDCAVILWCVSSVITFTLLWGEWQAFINRMGFVYSIIGGYFIVRFLLRDEEDVDRVTRLFVVICAILAVSMTVEYVTGRNVFDFFGGVPTFGVARDGKIRAQGPFAHPILAGTFGAILLPLFLGLWWRKNGSRALALVGAVSALTMAITTVSSTPLVTVIAGVGTLFLWPFRKMMRLIRWGIALGLIGLHLVMKAPVWALIARVDLVGGSSGDHRFQLVDKFIRHFGEWWLLGAKNNGQWGVEMSDTVNWFVASGVDGGLITLILFIAVIVYGFKKLGIARNALEGNLKTDQLLWVLGCVLFANVVTFFGVGYFDQTMFAWLTLLAMISAATAFAGEVPVVQPETLANFARAGFPKNSCERTGPAVQPFRSRGL